MSGNDDALELNQLLQIMVALRDPASGCPWDLEQNFSSIAPHTLEEVYEVVDAIESGDLEQLRSELGDLLFQIVFYAQIGKEKGIFDFGDIATGISTKLLLRHPHVFPDGSLTSAGKPVHVSLGQVIVSWEQIKADERKTRQSKGQPSMLDDVPVALPALPRAAKLQKRAALQGFDWDNRMEVLAKVREEITELEEALEGGNKADIAEEFGDILFSLVNLGRHLELDAETSLRHSSRKFERRFRQMEKVLTVQGKNIREVSADELDRIWTSIKREEE